MTILKSGGRTGDNRVKTALTPPNLTDDPLQDQNVTVIFLPVYPCLVATKKSNYT